MRKLTTRFIVAKKEFLNSKGSEKSVENLYDIVYILKNNEVRSFQENYILIRTHMLLGNNILAEKIINKEIIKANFIQKMKLKLLLYKIDKLYDNWNIINVYRDLRDSKLIKEPSKLNIEDFIISKELSGEYCIEISKKINSIVIINKNVKNEDIWGKKNNFIASCPIEPNTTILMNLANHIKWLGEMKEELLNFYNNSKFEHKLNNVGQKWYDGLNVFDFSIYIDDNNNLETKIILHDYLQNDFGFILEIDNRIIKSIEYDPIL